MSEFDSATIKDLLQKGQSEYKMREAMRQKEPTSESTLDTAYRPATPDDNIEYIGRKQSKNEAEADAHRTLSDLGGYDAWVALQKDGRVSRKFALTKYLGWTEDDLLENERLWDLEHPPKISITRRMAPHAAALTLGVMVAAVTLAAIGVAAVCWKMLF